MTTPLHAEHPRPQLARPDWQDLNGAWGFADDPRDLGLAADWPNRAELDQAIRVPYPPESRASGVGGSAPHRIVWYHRTWHRTPRPGRRIILHFGAVDYLADVWVNGRHVGRHEGGQTSFGIDVTHSLAADGRQSIVVRAMDDSTDLEQPRGKQDGTSGPGGGGQDGTTGIWQGVWAEEVPPVHVEALRWTPVDNAGTVDLELRLSAAPRDPVRIGVRVFLGDRVLVDDTYRMGSATLNRRLNLFEHAADAEPWRWSPESPTLCDALITVHSGAEADAVHSYLGLRTVGTDESAFLLNQAPYYPRMVLHQGYWPQSHLAAPDPEALRREVELIRSLGFNGVRVHQKVEDPRFLYWCDRLGLLVFADAAATHRFSGRSLARTTRQWLEIIERDASHPSIVAWIAFHESSGVPDVATSPRQTDAVRALYHLIRASDPSRPVIGNDGFEYVCGELLGIHDYVPNPADLAHRYADRAAVDSAIAQARSAGRRLSLEQQRPPVPVMLTEFGGVPSGPGGPYGDSPDDLLKRLGALLSAVQAARGLAGFCYAQLADTGTERNGLLREDRTPKADVAAIARIIRGE